MENKNYTIIWHDGKSSNQKAPTAWQACIVAISARITMNRMFEILKVVDEQGQDYKFTTTVEKI